MSDFTWSHLSFDPSRPIKPTHDSPRVLVVGAGIIGLSIAWTLLDSGFNVTVLAEHFASRDSTGVRLTSQIAGALWEFPPAVCGHYNEEELVGPQRWAMVSYHVYKRMAEIAGSHFGVAMRETVYFFRDRVFDDEKQRAKMFALESSGVSGFEHNAAILDDYSLVDKPQWRDAYKFLSPVIDSDNALPNIMTLVEEKGAKFVHERIQGDLFEHESALLQKYEADIIVNASGLGARSLADDDTVYPLHGALLRVKNNKHGSPPHINKALVISAPPTEAEKTSEFVFIVPRNDGILYVGGFSAPVPMPTGTENNFGDEPWKIKSDFNKDPRIRKIRESARNFLSQAAIGSLDDASLDSSYPIAEGVRPARKVGTVRLGPEEKVEGSSIVHCYGHAGSGWLLSFGCALEVKAHVRHILGQKGLKLPPVQSETRSGTDAGADGAEPSTGNEVGTDL